METPVNNSKGPIREFITQVATDTYPVQTQTPDGETVVTVEKKKPNSFGRQLSRFFFPAGSKFQERLASRGGPVGVEGTQGEILKAGMYFAYANDVYADTLLLLGAPGIVLKLFGNACQGFIFKEIAKTVDQSLTFTNPVYIPKRPETPEE